jgi:hypothetical protein
MDANASAKPASAMPVSITTVRRFMVVLPYNACVTALAQI